MEASYVKLKYLLVGNRGGVWGEDPIGDGDSVVLRSTEQTADGRWQIDNPAHRHLSAAERRRFRLVEGDVLVTKSSGSETHIGKATLVDTPVAGMEPAYSNFMQRLRPGQDLDPRFLCYLLQSSWTRAQLSLFSTTTTGLSNLTGTLLGLIAVPLITVDGQRAIADYLDRETAQIDAFIAKNEELITLLTERRAAQIDTLLSPERAQRREVKLGLLFTFHNGDRGASYPSRDEFVSEGVPFINAGHLENGIVDYAQMNYISIDKFDQMGGAKLKAGDLLFCLRGSLGKLGVFDGLNSGALASSLVALRQRNSELSVPYFAHLLQSSRARDAIDLSQTGTAQPNLSVDQLAQFRFAVPGPAAQHDVARQIESISDSVASAVATARRGVALARERRAALISAAVAGTIDVREAA